MRVALDLLLVGTLLSGLTALVIDPVMLLVRLRRWRADARDAAIRELANDQRHIANLVVHEEESLQFVKHWLTTRIGRIDTRVAQFFGKETALLSQLGLAYAILKEGGWSFLVWQHFRTRTGRGKLCQHTDPLGLRTRPRTVFGRHLASRDREKNRYQLELIDLALKQKMAFTGRKE